MIPPLKWSVLAIKMKIKVHLVYLHVKHTEPICFRKWKAFKSAVNTLYSRYSFIVSLENSSQSSELLLRQRQREKTNKPNTTALELSGVLKQTYHFIGNMRSSFQGPPKTEYTKAAYYILYFNQLL